MDDWQVGDLAVSVGPTGKPGSWTAKGGPRKGSIQRVADLVVGHGWTALLFDGYPAPHWTRGWNANCFRKVRPDEQQACEPEFVQLLKRSEQKVSA